MSQTRLAKWSAEAETALSPGARVIIAAVSVSMVLATVGVVLAWGAHTDRVDREREQISQAAAAGAGGVSQFFRNRLEFLRALAAMPGIDEEDLSRIWPLVEAAGDQGIGLSGGVGWVDRGGLLQAWSGADPSQLPIDLSDNPYVTGILESGLPSVGDVIVVPSTEEIVAILAVPTFSQGQVNGFLAALMVLDDLDEATLPPLGPPRYVTRVVDGEGRVVLTDGRAGAFYLPQNPGLLEEPWDTSGPGLMGDLDRMIGMAHVGGTGWTVVVEQDRTVLLAHSRGRLVSQLGPLLLLALTTVGVAVVVATKMDASHRRMLEGARNLATLETLSERLSTAPGTRDVADAVLDVFGSVFGAESTVVGLVDREGRMRLYTIADDVGALHADGPDEVISTGESSILVEAFESTEELLRTAEELRAQYPDLPLSREVSGLMAGRFVGRNAKGMVGIFLRGSFPPRTSEVELFATMVPLLGDAFGRATAAESERLASRVFQQALLPRDTVGAGVNLQRAVRYIAAVGDAEVGGDWYDLWMIDQHRVGAVVGDVVGRGVVAAAAMGQLRTALRATTANSATLGEALAQLDDLTPQISGSPSATVIVSSYDTRNRGFELASAGHPPPLLATKQQLRAMHEVRGTPIGFINERTTRVSMSVELEPEDTLVFYSDGLVERRGESIDEGIDRLCKALAEHRHLGVEALADALLRSCLEPDHQDDVALIVLRPVGPDPLNFTRAAPVYEFSDLLPDVRAWMEASHYGEAATALVLTRLEEAFEVVARCVGEEPQGDLVVELSGLDQETVRVLLEYRRGAVGLGTDDRVSRMILRGWGFGEMALGGPRFELAVGGAPIVD